MANIKYIVTPSNTAGVGIEEFQSQDLNLISNFKINSTFTESDYIELHIYSLNGDRLRSIYNYNQQKQLGDSAPKGTDGTSALYINPEEDIKSYGFPQGDVKLLYHFLRVLSTSQYFIDGISPDRTELRIKTGNTMPVDEINAIIAKLEDTSYFSEFRLNFSNNELIIGINLRLEGELLYIKLYEPLPEIFSEKAQFYLVEKVSNSYTFEVLTQIESDPVVYKSLRGANFDIEADTEPGTPTEFLDYNELYSYPVTSSYHRLLSQLSGSGVEVSVDYTDFTEFVHFSSAKERLENFRYKLDLVQTYESASAAANIASVTTYYDNLISGVITKFDGYEKYLYFESGAYAWPKSNSTPPYLNQDISTAGSIAWYAQMSESASLYDELNESNLEYTIPEFIRQDSANEPYSLFLNMIGQHFDNIWIYIKAMTDKYDADNRLGYGVSKDLVADTLRSFGVKLYNSNFSVGNLSSLLLGEWYDSGSEDITSFVTASNFPTPDQDILQETYKRIYHNLPYLIKTKGTERGLRALINCFGIPSGSLEIKTFGGVNNLEQRPYYGSGYPSGSKIRLDNTGSLVSGDTLSYYTSITKDEVKYTQDSHVVEVGFSPAYNINNFINASITGSFNIDQYIGDPRYLYSSNYEDLSNANLYRVAETLLSGSAAYDVFDFVRLIKFFDNQLFKMVKDFIPARDVTTSGIIIKPHILNRSKVKSPQATGTRPEYSASIDTAFLTGSEGEVINYSTAYTASVIGNQGTVIQIQNTEVERFNGELGGTVIDIYPDGLNTGNIFTEINNPELRYDSTGSASNPYPATGQYFWRYVATGPTVSRTLFVDTLLVNERTKDNLNIDRALSRLNPGDTIKYQISGSITDGTFPPVTTQVFRSFTGTVASKTVYFNPGGQRVWTLKLEPTNVITTGFDSILETFNYGSIADVKVIIEPFLNEDINFYNSDFNALLNNATTISNAAHVQKVDYSTNPFTPVNIEAIRDNTAERAEMNEYLHNSAGMVRGRYTGKQLSGTVLNEFTIGDTSYGKTPVVEQTTPYFCVFDYISGFSPEHNQADAVVIKYIVDEGGNVTTPDIETAQDILEQSFRNKDKVSISFNSTAVGGTEATLLGEQEILRAGSRIEPILYSYSATTYLSPVYSAATKLQFQVDPTLTTYDVVATGSLQSPSTTIDVTTQVLFQKELKDDSNSYTDGSTSIFAFSEDSDQPVKFTANIRTVGAGAEIPGGPTGKRESAYVEYRLEASSNGTFNAGTVTILDAVLEEYNYSNSITIDLNSGYRNFFSGSAVRVAVTPQDIYLDSLTLLQRTFQAISEQSGSSFVAQSDNGQGYFFTTGSGVFTNTVLTASLSLSSKYDNLFQGLSGSGATGFNAVNLPFTIQPGDEIKFNNDEKRAHLVTAVQSPTSNPEQVLYITLADQVSKGANTNFFAIRRYIDAPNMLLIRVPRVAGTQVDGILYPKYPSKQLKENFTTIVSDLKSKGIL